MIGRLALLTMSLAAAPVCAAPLCVDVQGIPPQCLYVDLAACEKEALRQGGVCMANPAELLTQPGSGQFCLVESGLVTTCVYPDRTTCRAEAARRGAACVQANQEPGGQPNIDPFRIRRPY